MKPFTVMCVFAALVASPFVFVFLSSAANQCDAAYPGVCIPSPPPDLDCKDISYRNFKVLPPDPHRFDGDKDGIGCEKR
jgi:hypothetical protein